MSNPDHEKRKSDDKTTSNEQEGQGNIRDLTDIADEVEKVSQGQDQLREQLVKSQSLTISSTLPPDYLQAYEEFCPGAGRKILLSSHELAEREQEVELELRKREQSRRESDSDRASNRADRAQVFAFVLALITLIGGIVLTAIGRDVGGLAAIITPVVGLVAVFIVNRAFPARRQSLPADIVNTILSQLSNEDHPDSDDQNPTDK